MRIRNHLSSTFIALILPLLLALPTAILPASHQSIIGAQNAIRVIPNPTSTGLLYEATTGAHISPVLGQNAEHPDVWTLQVNTTRPDPSQGSKEPQYHYVTHPDFQYGLEVWLSPRMVDGNDCGGGKVRYAYAEEE